MPFHFIGRLEGADAALGVLACRPRAPYAPLTGRTLDSVHGWPRMPHLFWLRPPAGRRT
jgi:hypothetical protein